MGPRRAVAAAVATDDGVDVEAQGLDGVVQRSIVRGDEFSPGSVTDVVRVQLTDYAAVVLGNRLFRQVFGQAPGISVQAGWLSPESFDDLEHGRADLVLTPVPPPAPLRWQPLFTERFVCVLSRDHPLTADRLTVEDLASYPHASVVVLGAERMLAESRLATLGITARPGLRVPFFTGAIAALPGTPLIGVLPSRLVDHVPEREVRVAAAPSSWRISRTAWLGTHGSTPIRCTPGCGTWSSTHPFSSRISTSGPDPGRHSVRVAASSSAVTSSGASGAGSRLTIAMATAPTAATTAKR